jgi:tape measure domain-containing protein
MSKMVDERVVSMQFDNKNFENNVRTSMSTLEKLKKSLHLPGASKGLESVGAAAKKVDMAGLGTAVDSVKLKFSALQVMAVTALANITNSAVNAGKNLVKAFTIDPIKTGLQEYETQIGAIQTILANTESKGTTLDQVNAALDELNTYADKTIYNFTEMTRNIGTFTAAGTDLETSVNAIQGIANLAAISGSTSQQASTAMYQLSQALASGTVKLMDWNSVVNAGMGGQVFQDALKETARVHGVAIDEIIANNGSFRDSLSEEWLTADILTETLMKFTMATEGLTAAQIEQNRAMLKGLGYSDEQIEGIFKLGNTATNAATKVKTFTQLMDTLKEAAQSGWAQTWRLLIGDFEEAKTLWTGVSDTLGEIINKSSERRNKVLGGALNSNWDKLVTKINEAGIETTKFEDTVKSIAKDQGHDVDKLIEKYGSLGEVFKSGALDSDILNDAVDKLNRTMEKFDASQIKRELKMGMDGEDVKAVQTVLEQLGYGELLGKWGADGKLGKYTEAAIKAFQEAQGLKVTGIVDDETLKALENATDKTGDLKERVGGLIDEVDKLGGRDLLIKAFGNAWQAITKPIKKIGSAWKEVFGTIDSQDIYKAIEGFEAFTASLIPSGDQLLKLKRTFKGLFSVVDIVASVVGGALKFGFDIFGKAVKAVSGPLLTLGEHVGDALTKFRLWLKDGDKVNAWFEKNKEKVKEWVNTFLETPVIKNAIDKLKDSFGKLGESFGTKFEGFGDKWSSWIERIKTLEGGFTLDNIKNALVDFKDNVIGPMWKNEDGSTIFDGLVDSIKGLWTATKTFFGDIGVNFEKMGAGIGEFFSSIKEWITGHMGAILAIGSLVTLFTLINGIKGIIETLVEPLAAFDDVLQTLSASLKRVSKALSMKFRAEAIKDLSIAIGILVASIVALTMVDETKLLGATAALLAVMTAMIILVSVAGKAGEGISKIQDAGKMAAMLLSLGASLVMMAAAIKMLAGIKVEDLGKAVLAMGSVILAVVFMAQTLDKLGGQSFDNFGKMMLKLSAGLMILSLAVKAFGNMDTGTLLKGGVAVGAFLILMGVMMKFTKGMSGDLPRFGSMMIGLSVALLSLSAVVGIFGNMKTDTLLKGGAAVGAFLLMMAGIMKLTKGMSKDIPRFGSMMLGLSIGLLALSGAVAILGRMDTGTLLKGGAVIAAFMGLMVGMMAATKMLGKRSANMAKVGLTMLAFSAAMLLISASIAALSFIKPEDLNRATGVILSIGMMFAALMAATQHASSINWGTIIALGGSLVILAGAIAALSFIDPGRLAAATAAIALTLGTLALLMSSFGKFGPKSLKDVGMLAATLLAIGSVISVFAAVGIGAMPTIGDKLSEFMTNLVPFLDGLERIDNSSVMAISALGQTIAALAGAALKFTIADTFTDGGSAKALESFKSFITEIVPVVKNLAKELSAEDLNLDTGNLNAVLDAVKTLAEAASMAPTAIGGGVMTTMGGGGFFSVPLLDSFKSWITEVVPIVKDLAKELSVSGFDVNETNLNAVVGAANTLADAAAKAPSLSVSAFGSKWGGGALISAPMLGAAADWVVDVTDALGDLAAKLSTECPELNVDNLNAVIGAAVALTEASANIPTVDVAAGGLGGKWGGGGGAFVSVPMISAVANWISGIREPIVTLAKDISSTDISPVKAEVIETIVRSVSGLVKAMEHIPSQTIAGGIAGGGWGAALGGVYSAPNINQAVKWISDIKQPIMDLANATSTGLTTNLDKGNLEAIVDAAVKLTESLDSIPKTTIAGGIAGGAWGIAAGGMYSASNITEAANWISTIKQPIIDLANATSTGLSTEFNKGNLDAIVDAAVALATASGELPQKTITNGSFLSWFGGGTATVVSSTDFAAATKWITEVAPEVKKLAESVSGENYTINTDNLTSITDAVSALSTAAGSLPSTSWFDSTFGDGLPDYTGFITWLTGLTKPLVDLSTAVSGATIDAEAITVVSKAGKSLAQMASAMPKEGGWTEFWSGTTGWDSFATNLTTFGEGMVKFSQSVSGKIDLEAVDIVSESGRSIAEMMEMLHGLTGLFNVTTTMETFSGVCDQLSAVITNFSTSFVGVDLSGVALASDAAWDIAMTLTKLSGFDYATIDVESFKTKAIEIASAIKEFSSHMDSIDVTSAVSELEQLTSALSKIDATNFSGAGSLKDTLKKLGTVSVDELTKSFKNAAPKVTGSVNELMSRISKSISSSGKNIKRTISNITVGLVSVIRSHQGEFVTAGGYLVDGFAAGITANAFKAVAAAAAMAAAAAAAARRALKIKSPSRVFYKIGDFVGQGFVNALYDYESKVYGASQEMASYATRGFSKAISKVSDIINNGVDSQPTIRPVLDLSEVSAGADGIAGMFDMKPSVGVMSNIRAINSMMSSGQNGANRDVVSAIKDLAGKVNGQTVNNYTIDGVTYDDGSNITDAVGTLVKAITVEGRV